MKKPWIFAFLTMTSLVACGDDDDASRCDDAFEYVQMCGSSISRDAFECNEAAAACVLGCVERSGGSCSVGLPCSELCIGGADMGSPDAASDTGAEDAGEPDMTTEEDAGEPDMAAEDAGAPDMAAEDAGAPDMAAEDAGAPDMAAEDMATEDAREMTACVLNTDCADDEFCPEGDFGTTFCMVGARGEGAYGDPCDSSSDCAIGACIDGVACTRECMSDDDCTEAVLPNCNGFAGLCIQE